MKPVKTLVVLADDRQARVLVNSGVGKGLAEIAEYDAGTLSGADIAYSDTPGRSQSAPGGAHHAMEPSSSEERQNRERFARDLIAELEKTWTRGGYDRIVMAAPPKMLGVLREQLTTGDGGRRAGRSGQGPAEDAGGRPAQTLRGDRGVLSGL